MFLSMGGENGGTGRAGPVFCSPLSGDHEYGSKLNHQESDRRLWSMFPFARVPFVVPIFDSQFGKKKNETGETGVFKHTVCCWGRESV